MADIVDIANDWADLEKSIRLAQIDRSKLEAEPTGNCLACGEVLSGRRWCNADCRDLWEQDRRNK